MTKRNNLFMSASMKKRSSVKSTLTLLFVGIAILLGFESNAQSEEELIKIEASYNVFKTQLERIIGAGASEEIATRRYFAQFPRSLLNPKYVNYSVGISDPFTTPLEATQQAIKRACFIQALKENAKAFAVIDYYSKISKATHRKQVIGFKEMVKVFVDSLYDTKNVRIINHEYLKSGELILTVDFSKCKKQATTAIFELYKDTKEKGKDIQKTSTIKIISEEQNLNYNTKKDYNKIEIKSGDLSNNAMYENFLFSYKSYNTKFVIKGGLWAYMLRRLSDNILEDATRHTHHVKHLQDNQINQLMISLTRMSGFFTYNFKYKSFLYSLRQF